MEDDIWQQCLDTLKLEIPRNEFLVWLKPVSALRFNNELRLYVDNKYVIQFISKNYLTRIKKLIDIILNNKISIKLYQFDYPKSQYNNIPITNENQDLSSTLWPEMRFDNFIIGDCNKSAINYIFKLCNSIILDTKGNKDVTFIYGPCGLGKTHLLNAIGNEVLSKSNKLKILRVESPDFVQEMISACEHNKIHEMITDYESLDVFLIDSVQFFSDKLMCQELFLYILDLLLKLNKYIFVTSDVHPEKLEFIASNLNLQSLQNSIVKLQYPNINTRVNIINHYAEKGGYLLSNDIMVVIANIFNTSSILEMLGGLRRVINSSRFHEKEITIDYIIEVLDYFLHENNS